MDSKANWIGLDVQDKFARVTLGPKGGDIKLARTNPGELLIDAKSVHTKKLSAQNIVLNGVNLAAWTKSIDDWKNNIVNNGILVAKGLMGHYNKDIIIDDGGKNPNTYYPVVFQLPHDSRTYNLRIFRLYHDKPDTDQWFKSSKSHHAALHLDLEAGSRQWGGIDGILAIKRHVYQYEKTIQSVALSSPVGDKLIIYIRGGGGRFHLEGNLPSIMSPKVYTKQTQIYVCCKGKYKTIVDPRKNPKTFLKVRERGGGVEGCVCVCVCVVHMSNNTYRTTFPPPRPRPPPHTHTHTHTGDQSEQVRLELNEFLASRND